MLFCIGSVFLFIIGGITGVFLSSFVLDVVYNNTYFVVGHFHYVMVGAAIFGLIAGLYYYIPKMTGKMYNEKMANWHFITSFIGFNVLYFPMFFLYDMPRRIYTYQSLPSWNTLNLISTVGAFIFARLADLPPRQHHLDAEGREDLAAEPVGRHHPRMGPCHHGRLSRSRRLHRLDAGRGGRGAPQARELEADLARRGDSGELPRALPPHLLLGHCGLHLGPRDRRLRRNRLDVRGPPREVPHAGGGHGDAGHSTRSPR